MEDKDGIMNIKMKDKFITLGLYKIGFWFLIIFLFGFWGGMKFSQERIFDKLLKDSVKLGGIVIDNTVYDLKQRL